MPTQRPSVTVLNGGGYELAMFVPDTHVPFQDEQTLWVVERLMKELKPKKLIHGGDMFDFYKLSKYDKDPARTDSLQDELDQGVAIFERWRNILPDSEIHYLLGNHEDRLRKYLWSKASELNSLRALEIGELVQAKKLGIKVHDYMEALYLTPSFITVHGDIVRQGSAMTARAMLQKQGLSGISFHTHRLGNVYQRNRAGQRAWYEGGCVSSLFPEYLAFPDWQQAVTLGWFKKDGSRFQIQQISVNDHAFIYDGKRYGIGN